MLGEPICVSTLSSHCRGPFRCSSIQQGVLVTVCLLGEQNQMLETNRGGGGGGGGVCFWDKQAQEDKSAVVILWVDHRFER